MKNPLQNEIKDLVYPYLAISPLRNSRIFITGGTGFFGKWLLSTIQCANDDMGLGCRVVILSRNPASFVRRYPFLAGRKDTHFMAGDIQSFAYPNDRFDYIIHAATEASASLIKQAPLDMVNVIVRGIQQILDFSIHCKAKRFLLASSGAVYGKQPPDLTHVPEDYCGAPDCTDPSSCYGEAKRMAEQWCACYQHHYGLSWSSARCFAFVGPYLPLDTHFAIGNFIQNCLHHEKIKIRGDGTPYRSYMYTTDMVVWLLNILTRGRSAQAYNIGSEEAVSIKELAVRIKTMARSDNEIVIKHTSNPNIPPARYVPSTKKARDELNLRVTIGLDQAIQRTWDWHLKYYNLNDNNERTA